MKKLVEKTVQLRLVGLDGNAFSLMGAFSSAARRQGWTKEEIDLVINECTSGDYTNLVGTLANHCEDPSLDEDEDYEDEEDE